MADMECDIVSNPRQHSDCISSLPDEILLVILSHITTKLAVRTSVLSKRWKHVWRETPSISIDFYNDCRRVDPTSVDKTLSRLSSPKFTSFDLITGFDDTSTSHQIDSWIKLAMSRNIENLSLVIVSKYSFQDFFFKNSSLKHLSLRLGSRCDMIPRCTVSWTSLKSLSMGNCKLSNESIGNILCGCSMIESLMLNSCSGIDHLDLSKSMRLTRLEIIGNHMYWRPMNIVAPHIHYLSLELTSFDYPYNLVDVSSLTDAKLNAASNPRGFRQGSLDFLDLLLKILTKLQNVEKLTIETIVLQVLSLAEIRGVTFPQFKIKHLMVETKLSRCVFPGIVSLLHNSPGLKKITIHTTAQRFIPVWDLERYLDAQWLNPDHCWSGKYGVFGKVDAESKHVASFIELVLQKAKTLETMVLRLEGYLSATEYQKLLPMLPTVSSRSKKNVGKRDQGKAILNSFKITP